MSAINAYYHDTTIQPPDSVAPDKKASIINHIFKTPKQTMTPDTPPIFDIDGAAKDWLDENDIDVVN